MHTFDDKTLDVTHLRDPLDPADAGMDDGRSIGMLGIELHTRRHNRMNGVLHRVDGNANAFRIAVEQSFGNCPQYIQLRDFEFVRDPALPSSSEPIVLDALSPRPRDDRTGRYVLRRVVL